MKPPATSKDDWRWVCGLLAAIRPIGLVLVFVLLGLELELAGQAFGVIHVIPNTEINGLEQHAALFETVEVTNFADLTSYGDFVIGGDGDVAALDPAIRTDQLQLDAALTIDPCHDGTQRSDKLVLELIAA